MNKVKFTHVIFDLDGTILNTLDDLADSCNWVLTQHGWPIHPVERYRYFIGNGIPKLFECAAPPEAQCSPLKEQVLEEFRIYYDKHKADKTCSYEGVPQVLDQLKQAGVHIVVLTNKPDIAAKPIVERHYPGVFEAVQGSVPGVNLKPDPEALFRLMDQIGARPETTLFVGDTDVDMYTATNGNLTGCGVLWGFRNREELEGAGANCIAARPEDLLNIILG